MKKAALITLTLILFLFTSMFGQNSEADEAYIKAMTTPNVAQKAMLLKDYIAKYGGKGTKYENFACANLCLLPYTGKTTKETIEYGEKALSLDGLDDLTKCQVYIQLSGIYSSLSQNLNKAKNYAAKVVQIAEANKNKESAVASAKQWAQFIGAGYFAQGQAMEKSRDFKGASNAYIQSYNILKNKEILNILKKVGKELYDSKSFVEAEKVFKVTATTLNDYASIVYYAKSLHRNGKKSEALKYYKQAYAKQKSGDLAYNIGIILAEKANSSPSLSTEALTYLLEASFLPHSNTQKAMQLAESIFFTSNKEFKYNETIKELSKRSKKLEDITNSFNDKFGDKNEEDLTDAEKKEMETLLAQIDIEKKEIQKLEASQQAALEKFNQLIAQTKQKLGLS